MLRELRIENLLLIERAELRLGEGLNAITGETGAGKTVLAHALDLLLGGRARPQIVRPGAAEAWVEGVFALPDGLLADPELAEIADRLPDRAEEVVLGRRIGGSGRTSAFVAGRAASAADLQALGARLLAFYGQHEHRRLTLASAQLEILDGFAGAEHLELRDAYRGAHLDATRLGRELAELRDREGARERDLDLLRFELSEIEAAAPDLAEGVELESERSRLRHAEALRAAAGRGLVALSGEAEDGGGARLALGVAEAGLAAVDGVDPELDALAERAGAVAAELDDVAAELRGYLDGIEAEPGRLEAVEERLEAIDRLERKHGGSIEAVLEHASSCRAEIERLESAAEIAAGLDKRIAEAEAQRAGLAKRLGAGRREAAARLCERVAAELARVGDGRCSARGPPSSAPRRVRRVGRGDGRVPDRGEPGDADHTAQGRRLGRRALADHARADRPRQRGRGANAGLRRGRRGRRRQHRPGGGRAAAPAGAAPPGDLHHPSAPGGLARGDALHDREGLSGRPGPGEGRAGRGPGPGRRDRSHAGRRARRLGRQPPRRGAAEGGLTLSLLDEEISAYYERGDEARRLDTIARLEELRTRELMERFLPSPPAAVLDVGGGPGAYAFWLAERGYEVHLIDPVPLHVEEAVATSAAAAQPLASAAVGDARELERVDESVDAVLMLGPLYHLTERGERIRALAEARRVLRPRAPVLAAGISRFAPAVDGLRKGFLLDSGFAAIVDRDLRDGQHRNPSRQPGWFTTAYVHHPAELGPEVAEAGFAEVEVFAVEGIGELLGELGTWLDDPARRELLLRTVRRLEREPSLLGATGHLLAVGRA